MVFMNFIIAVIGESYSKVIENKMAHDYKQRIMMVYEREVHFSAKELENQVNFPSILIVRKKKETRAIYNNMQGWTNSLKTYMKAQTMKCTELINQRTKEQKQHMSNSIKLVENDMVNMSQDIMKVMFYLKRMNLD